jgi:hypothetical protein
MAEMHPVGFGEVTIARRTVTQDLVRRYTVFIDEKPAGYLWAFQTGRYEVSPGPHQVRLAMPKTGRASSDEVPVDVAPGGAQKLRTRGRGFRDLITLPIATVISTFDRSRGRPFETRWYKRPWIILQVDDRAQRPR